MNKAMFPENCCIQSWTTETSVPLKAAVPLYVSEHLFGLAPVPE